jgi:hypothetical protein
VYTQTHVRASAELDLARGRCVDECEEDYGGGEAGHVETRRCDDSVIALQLCEPLYVCTSRVSGAARPGAGTMDRDGCPG